MSTTAIIVWSIIGALFILLAWASITGDDDQWSEETGEDDFY